MKISIAFNSLRPRQNGRHFADAIFKCIFLNENVWIPIKISLKFVPKGPINDIPALVQIIAWRRPGDKPLSEPRLVSLPTHICVTRPQWVKHDSKKCSWNGTLVRIRIHTRIWRCCEQLATVHQQWEIHFLFSMLHSLSTWAPFTNMV